MNVSPIDAINERALSSTASAPRDSCGVGTDEPDTDGSAARIRSAAATAAGDGGPGGLEQRRGGRVGLLGQRLQDVGGLDMGMSVRGGRARGGRQGLVGLGRQLQIHGVRVPLSAGMRVCRFTEDNVGQS